MTVGVPSAMRVEMLRRREHRRRVRDAVAALVGRPLELTFELVDAPAPPARATAEPAERLDHDQLLQELKTMFNAVEEP